MIFSCTGYLYFVQLTNCHLNHLLLFELQCHWTWELFGGIWVNSWCQQFRLSHILYVGLWVQHRITVNQRNGHREQNLSVFVQTGILSQMVNLSFRDADSAISCTDDHWWGKLKNVTTLSQILWHRSLFCVSEENDVLRQNTSHWSEDWTHDSSCDHTLQHYSNINCSG